MSLLFLLACKNKEKNKAEESNHIIIVNIQWALTIF